MIEPIRDLPDSVLGFTAKGTVRAADYVTVIVPAVGAALAKHSKIRLLYHLGREFSGFEPAALWEDAKIGLKRLASWDRIAVVTDVEWIRAATKAFGFLLRGQVRLFHDGELNAAREWLTESATAGQPAQK